MSLIGLSADSPLVKYLGWDGELHYPSSDDQPFGNDTEHIDWIFFLIGAFGDAFADREDVLVACDLFWYPVEGRPDIVRAPDVLVAMGRPKGRRRSYKQWEEADTAPQFVAEVASDSNTDEEFQKKLAFYNEHGAQEYLLYDFVRGRLTIWRRANPRESLRIVSEGAGPWTSPVTGLQFGLKQTSLEILLPDGRTARTREELVSDWKLEHDRAEQQQARAERLAAKLRELGIDPE